jgi:hypothetical protein
MRTARVEVRTGSFIAVMVGRAVGDVHCLIAAGKG